jgi:site-specific recombinase XerD
MNLPAPVTPLTKASPFDEFYDYIVSQGRSEKTALAYASDMRKFLNWTGSTGIDLSTYDTQTKAFINELRQSPNASRSSVIRYMSSLRAYREFLASQGADVPVPFVGYKAPTPYRLGAHPLPGGTADVHAMVEAATKLEHKLLIALCGFAGLRVSEARTITPRSVIRDEQGYLWLSVLGKGDKYREVPVSDDLRVILVPAMSKREPDEPFVRLQDRGARKAITMIGIRAGISRTVSSHDLRHTFGSDIYNKTKDLRVTQELLGHASSSTTEGYTGISQEAMRKAVMEKLT